MKKRRSNIKYRNSVGVSKKEFLLKAQTGYVRNRDMLNDFDYIEKLTPLELAWLAEFAVAHTCGQKADVDIIEDEDVNKIEKLRAANAESMRRMRNAPEYNGTMYRITSEKRNYELGDTNENVVDTLSVVNNRIGKEEMIEALKRIDERWEDNRKLRGGKKI